MKTIIGNLISISIILLLLQSQQIYAQPSEIQFEHYTTSDGLAGDIVGPILQDRQGFLWIGTINGLSRYDGYSFKNYYTKQNDSTTLSFDYVSSICENPDGKLWLGTFLGGLNLFDPVSETFKRINLYPNDSSSISKNRIFNITLDKLGKVWILSMGGFGRFDIKTNQLKQFESNQKDSLSLYGYDIYNIFITKEGILWFLSEEMDAQALSRYDPSTDSFIRYSSEDTGKFSLTREWIVLISEDNEGNVFFGTDNSKLYWYNKETERIEPLLKNNIYNLPYAPIGNGNHQFSSWLTGFHQDKNGNYWVLTYDGGINFFESNSNSMQHLIHDPENKFSLNSNAVRTIYEDRQGIIWIGTDGGGLNKVIPYHNRFKQFTKNTELLKNIDKEDINTMLKDSFGKIWLGSNNGDIFVVDKSTKSRINFIEKLGFTPRNIFALFEDSQKIIWIGTNGTGLIEYSPGLEKPKRYLYQENNNGLSSNSILTIGEDSNGMLWIAAGGWNGVDRFNPKTETFKNYHFEESNKKSLSNDVVRKFFKDSENNFWLGTANGLNRYNPKSDGFDRFLPDVNIRSIYEDSKGRFWLSTHHDGLILFDRKNGEHIKYTITDGLLNDYTNNLIEDDNGFIWISSTKGLTRLNPEKMIFISFAEQDGVDNKFTADVDAVVKLKSGELIFSGTKGITTFPPEKIEINKFPPDVAITGLNIFDKPLKEKGSLDSSITLNYDQNDLTFEYVGLHFKNPAKNKYKVKLEPYEKEWQNVENNRTTRYTNLDPGEYTFKVTASNSDGVWNEKGKHLTIIIKPPLWKTWWAYAVYFLAFVSILGGIRKFELDQRKEKENKKLLQFENDRKTKELEEARQLQLSMLPKELPQLPNLDIAVYMKTATEVGGDYYDFNVGLDGTLTLAVGDATGHGMKAGTIVSMVKALFESNGSRLDMKTFFDQSSATLKGIKLGRLMMAFMMIKIQSNKIEIANAGMPPLFIYRKRSKVVEEIMLNGMPLGAMKNFPYEIKETEISSGDTILLLSDGLPELKNGKNEQYDYARVKEEFKLAADKSPNEIVEYMKSSASKWSNGIEPDDDVTFVVIKIK